MFLRTPSSQKLLGSNRPPPPPLPSPTTAGLPQEVSSSVCWTVHTMTSKAIPVPRKTLPMRPSSAFPLSRTGSPSSIPTSTLMLDISDSSPSSLVVFRMLCAYVHTGTGGEGRGGERREAIETHAIKNVEHTAKNHITQIKGSQQLIVLIPNHDAWVQLRRSTRRAKLLDIG